MLSVDAGIDGLPVIIAKLGGVAVYLDNWAIIELANGDAQTRDRFVTALKASGSLLFSFTNSIELGEAEGDPANRVRSFLDEIGAHWIPARPLGGSLRVAELSTRHSGNHGHTVWRRRARRRRSFRCASSIAATPRQ